ncbi:MAG: YjhG/YagF family D-xylonate dehydratase [Candidatus Dormibacteria bacterium]
MTPADVLAGIFDTDQVAMDDVRSRVPARDEALPVTAEMLRRWPSGALFGWSQNVGMGWEPGRLGGSEVLLLSTHGGIRNPDGSPVALGYHTGHWEVGLLVQGAAERLKEAGSIPFSATCTDPCDGRSQGSEAMFDSLPYRNDAATIFRRLIRSLPTRRGVIGVATCDKGLPAMMIALASCHDLPVVLVPGGVTLLPEPGEDAGKIQSVGARFSQGEITLEAAALALCRTCATPGGGCQFLGTAASSQVVAEAFGLALTHSALAPSGRPIWLEMARHSADAMAAQITLGVTARDIVTDAALHNAMVVHAAFGGSTNMIMHIPAVAFAAGVSRPSVADWIEVNRSVPRLVDAMPNGPVGHATIQVFMAGGVPEVMLHLRAAGLLRLEAMTAGGHTLGEALDRWEGSRRRAALRSRLQAQDGVDPDDVIMSPDRARSRGLTSTVTFPRGNLAPGGSVIKSTAIDQTRVDDDGVYRKVGPARVFVTEHAAIEAIKSGQVHSGDVVVLICRGPMGAGMEEIYEVTSALRYLPFGKDVALITDARFSGVSTGACVGHITPEALAGGPVGKIREGDLVEVLVDTLRLEGSINLVGTDGRSFSSEEAAEVLALRGPRPDLAVDPRMPADSRLWAELQDVGGGTWGGCVYDVDEIIDLLRAGRASREVARREVEH